LLVQEFGLDHDDPVCKDLRGHPEGLLREMTRRFIEHWRKQDREPPTEQELDIEATRKQTLSENAAKTKHDKRLRDSGAVQLAAKEEEPLLGARGDEPDHLAVRSPQSEEQSPGDILPAPGVDALQARKDLHMADAPGEPEGPDKMVTDEHTANTRQLTPSPEEEM
jgi:hypothetical protein